MYYSLTFEVGGVRKNTWADWRMIPDTPPMIPIPEPNLNYVDIPGRSGGPLDLTGIPFNKMTYKRMTGSWNFYVEPVNRFTRIELYEELRQYFHGKIGTVIIEEDPEHYYSGRFSIGVPSTSTGPIRFTISYDLVPRRWNVSNGAQDASYAKEAITNGSVQ